MKFLSMPTAAGAIAPAVALPTTQPRETCTNPAKRVEWRQLSAADQQSFINAVLCLKTKPSKMGLNTTLYDDFPYVHFNYNTYIHGSAPFLPWNRYFVHVYNNALREGGYEGPGTCDWTQDTAGLCLSAEFAVYHTALEGGPHGAIHACLGGEMNPGEMNPTTSPTADAREVTLDDILPVNGLGEDLTVRGVMDTIHGELCYTY
ncbi:Di-copper centre-containing protein [Apiospora phragmitis]|uniref:Di-copper centre-containing protein n=1 Tax=Apiospora phragmitis TaxID=2905665 RepID=A0ABR1TAY1_9PEZI